MLIDSRCKEVLRHLDVRHFVETGTDMGEMLVEVSRWFAEWDPEFGSVKESVATGARAYATGASRIAYPQFDSVGDSKYAMHSVDLDPHSYTNAKRLFESNFNISLYRESSEVFLGAYVQERLDSASNDGVFFFLDAHWGKY